MEFISDFDSCLTLKSDHYAKETIKSSFNK